jgi:hypothetical protein
MNDYGYMERESRYVEYYVNYHAETITEIGREYMKELMEQYDKECSNWFEDETFVEKQIPEFNFV